MTKTDKALEELKKLGYTDEKLKELLELLMADLQDQVLFDLAGVATDEDIDQYEKKASEARTKTELDQLLDQMARKAYGDNYKQRIEDIMVEMLNETAEQTKQVRKFYQDYMAGDPAAKKKYEELENSPEFKKMQEEMKAAGFDFRAEAAK